MDNVQNIRDITDSRELYEAKPRPLVSAFIYILLTILVIVATYTSIARIDIVTKASGVVIPNAQISTVKTALTGEVYLKNFEQGQLVKTGDLLFELDHNQLDLQLNELLESLEVKETELSSLRAYKESIDLNQNLVDPYENEFLYNLYEQYSMNRDLKINNLEYNQSFQESKVEIYESQISELEGHNYYINQLKSSIDNKVLGISDNGSKSRYYISQYNKIQSDLDAIVSQYDMQIEDIKNGQNLSLSEVNLESTTNDYYGYTVIKQSLIQDLNFFIDVTSILAVEIPEGIDLSVYRGIYDSYILQIEEYEEKYELLKKDYELKLDLEGLAVTAHDVELARQAMDNSASELNVYIMNFYNDIDQKIRLAETNMLTSEFNHMQELSTEERLDSVENDKTIALAKYTDSILLQLNENYSNNSSQIINLKNNLDQALLEGAQPAMQDEKFLEVELMKTTELVSSLSEIEKVEEEVRVLEANIASINEQIKDSIYLASIDGRVNIMTDILEGDTVFGGAHVLTIVPEEDTNYQVKMMLNNKDITSVKIGD